MANLIAIVPAKASSTRVPGKNYRGFHDNKSLVDLTIEKLKDAGVFDIYLSCEDAAAVHVAESHRVRFSLRAGSLCSNDCPIPNYIRGITSQVWEQACGDIGGEAASRCDILWAQVTDPLFSDYSGLIDKWEKFSDGYDSAVVVHPRRKYLLDANHQPLGFGFGPWHVKSQCLPVHYELPFTASILTRRSIERTGYFVGAEPLWYESDGPSIDIDTPEDFELARQIYALRNA